MAVNLEVARAISALLTDASSRNGRKDEAGLADADGAFQARIESQLASLAESMSRVS